MDKYHLALSFRVNEDVEEEIEDVLGMSHGSGCGFGERDLSYYFKHKNSLYAAVRKVKKLRRRIRYRAYEILNEDFDEKKISLKDIK